MRLSRTFQTRAAAAFLVATGCALASRSACAQTAPSPSQTLPEARTHFERGIALFRDRDLDAALAEFLRAYQLSDRPSVLFNISATYQALHRYPEALDTLRRYLANPNGDARQRVAAERALRELEALVAHVRIAVIPADAVVTLDGRTLENTVSEIAVGPGQHVIEVTRDGFQSARQEWMIASGESRDVRFELVPIPVVTIAPTPASPVVPEPAPPLRARLSVSGAPTNAVLDIDGSAHPASDVASMEPGPHRVSVSAPGMRGWHGDLALTDDRLRTLRVTLVPDHTGPGPGYFGAAAVVTGVLVGGAVVFGALTLQTDAEFQSRSQTDPDVDALASRGHAFATTADILGIGAVIAGAVAIVLFTRTEFTQRASHAEFVMQRMNPSLPHGPL